MTLFLVWKTISKWINELWAPYRKSDTFHRGLCLLSIEIMVLIQVSWDLPLEIAPVCKSNASFVMLQQKSYQSGNWDMSNPFRMEQASSQPCFLSDCKWSASSLMYLDEKGLQKSDYR
jgi:hypothetical protein